MQPPRPHPASAIAIAMLVATSLLFAGGATPANAAPTHTDEIHAPLAAGNERMAVDTRTGILYLANTKTNAVFAVNPASPKPEKTRITTGWVLGDVAVDPFERELYVSNREAAAISVHDLTFPAGPITAIIPLRSGCDPTQIEVDPAFHRLFVADRICETVWVIDLDTNTVEHEISDVTPAAIAPDGAGGVFVANRFDDTIEHYEGPDLAVGETIASVLVSLLHADLEFDADADRLYFGTGWSLVTIALSDHRVVSTEDLQEPIIGVEFDETRQILYSLDLSGVLRIRDTSGSGRVYPALTHADAPSDLVLDTQLDTAYILSRTSLGAARP